MGEDEASEESRTRVKQVANRFRPVLAALVILLAILIFRVGAPELRWPWNASPPRVTQDMVVTQIENVAKLVSTELTLRDVVSYEQSRFGLRRRALFVVTGKVFAGIDLKNNVQVRVDDRAKRITIDLPRAEILAVEVLNTKTYDETSPLFFGFQPADRDSIQALIRTQLRTTGEQSGLLQQADRSARQFLESLLARDGYAVVVTTRTELAPRPVGGE